MAMVLDRVEEKKDETLKKATQETVIRFDFLSAGYLPDEDDPAWPSKTGQAD